MGGVASSEWPPPRRSNVLSSRVEWHSRDMGAMSGRNRDADAAPPRSGTRIAEGFDMKLGVRVLVALAMAILAALSFLPACDSIGPCGNCNPASEYCLGMSSLAMSCQSTYSCQPIPAACKANPTCACLGAPSMANYLIVSCSGNAKTGFEVDVDPSDC